MTVVDSSEKSSPTAFFDVGALAYYLNAVPWQVPGFSIDRYRECLKDIHDRIQAEGALLMPGHLFLVEAMNPQERG